MIFAHSLTIPTNTLPGAPLMERMPVVKGLVYRINVIFPPGCKGLVSFWVNDGLHQLWPSTPNQQFVGSGMNYDFEDLYLKEAAPFQFQVYGTNTDEIFNHTVYLLIGMISKEIFMARFLPTLTVDAMEQMYERMQKSQEEQKQAVLNEPFPGFEPMPL